MAGSLGRNGFFPSAIATTTCASRLNSENGGLPVNPWSMGKTRGARVMNTMLTWSMTHPNEYMSLCVVGMVIVFSSSGNATSSGAIHLTVPLKADV